MAEKVRFEAYQDARGDSYVNRYTTHDDGMITRETVFECLGTGAAQEIARLSNIVEALKNGDVAAAESACEVAPNQRIRDLEMMLRAALRSKARLQPAHPNGFWLARHGGTHDDGTGLPVVTENFREALERLERDVGIGT